MELACAPKQEAGVLAKSRTRAPTERTGVTFPSRRPPVVLANR